MPITYRIDEKAGVVFASASGSSNLDEMIDFMRKLASDPRFAADFRLLFDSREVIDLPLSSSDVIAIAQADAFGAGSRRALVVPNDLLYGLARMFEVYAEAPDQEVAVFRDMESARRWLGLRDDA